MVESGFVDISDIIEKIRTGAAAYRPFPFWSWNGKLEKERLLRQIDELYADGMGGFIMHARSGLKTDYLSEEWMQAVEACGDYGRARGMEPWIYDENGWPSGFAGGRLLEDAQNRDKYIEHTVGALDASADVCYILEGERLVRADRPEPGATYLNLHIRTAASTADICNPAVVRRFIALTHAAYKARFGVDFAARIQGFFTDEPQYQRWGTPYTDMVAAYFRETYHEDILDRLGLLFVEKDGYRDFRYRYWRAMQTLMLHSFSETVYDWCTENGVQLTGHYIEETSMGYQLMCCGGVMPFYAYEHIPGIDWLRRDTDNELPVRQVSSVAAQLGKKKVLTESFACCGWDVTPTELRRIVGFQFVGGVNWLCTHLVPYSEAGLRKHDYPAHYSRINRWVEQEFPAFNTFVARLGGLIGESEEVVNVAVLHPIRSAYFDYQRGDAPNEEEFHIRPLDEALRRDVRWLSAHGVNYHFVDETLLARYGSVEGAALCCGRCRYTYWVLPHVQTMDRSTEELLRQFVQNGGKVLVLGENPRYREAESYAYDYLTGNCTFAEICAAQPCRVAEPDTELYYTYRRLQGRDVLVVQNASGENSYTQRFLPDGRYRSFLRLDLNTLETESVPLELTFEPNGCMVLFPDEAQARPRPRKPEIPVYLEQDAVTFDENTLVVDTVRYSRDGAVFSKPYPVAGLFAKLLEERYEGDIYFAYTFSVRERPGRLCLRVEPIPGAEYTFNGRPLTMAGSPKDPDVWCADVTALVHEGDNTLVVKADWFQDDRVYYALFGENVTESLKNCLVYDRELEPIYCVGDFGVYTDGGFRDVGDGFAAAQDFYIAAPPRRVTEPVTDGLPFFSGILTVRKTLHLTDPDVTLRLPGKKMVARVRLNGHTVGTVLFGETIDIGAYAVAGDNELEIAYTFSNRNTYGPHHSTDPVTRRCAAPEFFEMKDWKDGVSPGYSDAYELLCFGAAR